MYRLVYFSLVRGLYQDQKVKLGTYRSHICTEYISFTPKKIPASQRMLLVQTQPSPSQAQNQFPHGPPASHHLMQQADVVNNSRFSLAMRDYPDSYTQDLSHNQRTKGSGWGRQNSRTNIYRWTKKEKAIQESPDRLNSCRINRSCCYVSQFNGHDCDGFTIFSRDIPRGVTPYR